MSPVVLYLATTSTGAAGAADALSNGLTAAAFWDALAPFWPVIIGLAIFAFVYGFIRKLVRRSSKGKSV